MALSTQSSAAPKFAANFCHKIEGKNRITIPSAWRYDEEVTMYMTARATQRCVAVMPWSEVERIAGTVDASNPRERSEMLDTLGSDLKQVTLDKTGRISIPDDFFELLNLPSGREVWLSGSLNMFNIWSVEEFEKFQEAEKARKEALKRKMGI